MYEPSNGRIAFCPQVEKEETNKHMYMNDSSTVLAMCCRFVNRSVICGETEMELIFICLFDRNSTAGFFILAVSEFLRLGPRVTRPDG